jgi:hypothetical protein
LESAVPGQWLALSDGQLYRQCNNYSQYAVCNWMVGLADPNPFCASCRLNHIIPNLSEPQNIELWRRIEQAKRRLLFTLYRLGLPVIGRDQDPQFGLMFEFLADAPPADGFTSQAPPGQPVITGHQAGLITINLKEAEHSAREQMREMLNEAYRTLLGHFRHESGHYYWGRLIGNTNQIHDFRGLFGDERQDYQMALQQRYQQATLEGWQQSYISSYAAMHPWEDWAETWAHYLHIVDTLETAHDFGFSIAGKRMELPEQLKNGNSPLRITDFDELLQDWTHLSVALNALNRSMGLNDAYPFAVTPPVVEKLRFVHNVIDRSTA